MSISQAVRAQLHDHPRLWLAARAARRAVGHPLALAKRTTQRLEIDRYLAAHERRRVVLGAGPHRRDGWLSTDLRPASWATYLDVSRPFPLPDAAIDLYHAEHVIEHVGYDGALRMAKEMRRTLRPGGIARIATPDLGRIAGLLGESSNEGEAYVQRANASWASRPDAQVNDSMPVPYRNRAAFVVNRLFYGFGHRFVFDQATLADLLERAGFATLRWCDVGHSDHDDLRGIEDHGGRIGHAKNDYETMVVEAS